jgi:peptide/nickel transport system substrate-binding protein
MKRLLYIAATMLIAITACTPTSPPAAETSAAPSSATVGETSAASDSAASDPAAAGSPAAPNAEQSATRRLVAGLQFAPRAGWAIETNDAFVLTNLGVLETLVRVDFEGELVPSLAESWAQVDQTTWEFTLRPGVAFHNDQPLNAEAVVGAFNYLLDTPTPPRGFATDSFTATAVSDLTVQFITAEPDALLPERLTSPNAGILAPAAYLGDGPTDPLGTGTGPFVLTEDVPEQRVTLQKNPNYWGGAVALDQVEVQWVPDATVRAGMLGTGELDIAEGIPIPQVPVLQSNADVATLTVELPRTTSLYMNHSREPFSDPLVRQAIHHAIDKDALVAAILEGIGAPAVGPFNPGRAWAASDLATYAFDVERAQQLLAEAGYDQGELQAQLWTYSDRPELSSLAQAIQSMLGEAGITAEIRVAEYNTVFPDVEAGNFDLFILSRSYLTDAYDPVGFLTSDFTCDGSYNLNKYCNPAYDQVIAPAQTIAEQDARYEVYREAQRLLATDAVYVPLVHEARVYGHRATVLNYRPHPLDHYTLVPQLDLQTAP